MLKKFITKNLSGKRVVLWLIVANAFYFAMLFITIPKAMLYANGMKILDMMPSGYNHEYVNKLMETLGEKGRAAYLFCQIPLDLFYPFLFGISMCFFIAYLLNKIGKLDGRLFLLTYFPLFAGLFDYFENFSEIGILISFPNNPVGLSLIASFLTVTKSILYTATFLILITLLILWGIHFIRNKKLKIA